MNAIKTTHSADDETQLELAYLRAMQEWMTEEHNTRMLVMRRDTSGFSAQLKKEEAALKTYRRAQLEFIQAHQPTSAR